MTDPWARPADQPPVPPPPPFPQGAPPSAPDPGAQPKGRGSLLTKLRDVFSDPLSIVLAVVIVVALIAAGLLGGELYARNRADDVVSRVVSCVVEDEATASFDALPPFLLQHMTGHYTNINIETAGNQIRNAKGMKVGIDIKDVRLEDSANSSGSMGSLAVNVTWSSEGITQTVQDAIPLFGSFLTGVTTNPAEGTIELEGALGNIVAKPEVANGGITLQVQQLTGLGFTLPREAVQPALNAFTAGLTENYPMDIKAQSIEVTDTGITALLSSQNAEIPKGGEDPCFNGL
ncbi:LmeA family phospholipid-binding protein [Mycolicibacterium litorale]|uniref:DUF2993 domain-containing protein n=1 Tax=Mycolicibacterium litorale TaxID=758802 RepID=A0AAD1IN05_9MYCO|nr:DUF2993 domain-containing protein [Mycolicibacterium litorale]MCV7416704.1 DUF2993 domain-containing protein [Mycolicibacterium litorale]TDY09956.1 Protein of unknown function (DUF2993) [Mycolicibacterium litorale]BBY17916.1 hypothetical protein MLIT_35080 [Mycolicibacterium litorale]